jgi:hypothetical protein
MTTIRCNCAACLGRDTPFEGISLFPDRHITEADLIDQRAARRAPAEPEPAVTAAELRAAVEANTNLILDGIALFVTAEMATAIARVVELERLVGQLQRAAQENQEVRSGSDNSGTHRQLDA